MRRNKMKICCYFLLMTILCCNSCAGKKTGQLEEIQLSATEQNAESEKTQESPEKRKDTSSTEELSDVKRTAENVLFVHICGAVVNPGVYEMPAGSRIYEGIRQAGGMTDQAATDALNQAEPLQDGQRIYVPTLEETMQSEWSIPQEGTASAQASEKVNLNSAAKEVLMTLSGIGESKADSIIRYREENGGFRSIDEVMEIEGIKNGVFQKIKDQITV